MSRPFRIAALLVLATGSPALADLTVDDAWATWQAQIRALGLTMQASETRDGDALQIGDIRLSLTLPNGAGSGYVEFTGPRFELAGDGAVSVGYANPGRLAIGGTLRGQGNLALEATTTMTGFAGRMSGTPDRVVSDWSANGGEFRLTRVAVDGEKATGINANGILTLGPLTLQNITTTGAHLTIRQTAHHDGYSTAYDLSFPGETNTRMTGHDTVKSLKSTTVLVLPPEGLNFLNLHNQLRAGLRLSVRADQDSQTTNQSVSGNGTEISHHNSVFGPASALFNLDRAGLELGGEYGTFDLDLLTPDLPFALRLSGASAKGHALVPLLTADDSQDAAYLISLRDVSLGDSLWALFDPTAQLPRDPMTFTLDLSGKLKVLRDLADVMGLITSNDTTSPVRLEALRLNDLQLRGAGAELTGNGGFSFDNSDFTTLKPMPRPEGAAEFLLTGGNALLDKLLAMGLISDDDALGARLAVALIAKPVADTTDTLKSHIQVTPQGHLIANGQRLK